MTKMTKKNRLSEKEEMVLEFFWSKKTSLTSVDMVQYFEPLGWSDMSVYRAINSLMEKDLLRVCGKELYHSQYARRFEPTLTKEEYVVYYLYKMKKSVIAKIVLALVKADAKKTKSKEELIAELESIIDEFRERQELQDKQGK